MKKMLCIIPITFLALLLLIGFGNQACLADPIDGSGYSILVIDGTDGDTAVTYNILKFEGTAMNLYSRINGGGWGSPISWIGNTATLSYTGGDVLDFWLDVEQDGVGGNDLYSYNSVDASLQYSGSIAASNAQNPTRTNPYYRTLAIDWIGVTSSYNINVVTSDTSLDGSAPVPIPSSVLLLGAGLLGLIGIGYRRRKSTAG